MAGKDPSVELGCITEYLRRSDRRSQASILVMDFKDSTARKVKSGTPLLALAHILLHNLMPLSASAKKAVCKLTGDGCILVFPERDFETLEAACLAAVEEAVCFSARVEQITSSLRPARDGSAWGLYTKCALNVGEVYLVNYRELYGISQDAEELKELLRALSAPVLDLLPATDDPHGESVDLAFRILAHCKSNQILASSLFCASLGGSGLLGPFSVSDESEEVYAKGALGDMLEVKEIVPSRETAKGISPKQSIDWQWARPVLEALKLTDEALDGIYRSLRTNRASCTTLLQTLSNGKGPVWTDSSSPEREALWRFLDAFQKPVGEPSEPFPVQLAPLANMTSGKLVTQIHDYLTLPDVDLHLYADNTKMRVLRLRADCLDHALEEFLGATSFCEESAKDRFVSDQIEDTGRFKNVVEAAVQFIIALDKTYLQLSVAIDKALRAVLGLSPKV